MKRILLPGLCAVLIVAIGYLALRDKPDANKEGIADLYGIDKSKIDSVTAGADNGVGPEGPSITTNDNQNIMTATFHTNYGDFAVEFNPNTPNTVANFVKLAKSGFYDGTKFHRVIAGFMNQGGDPFSKDDSMMSRWGTGGPGYQFADEIKPGNSNEPGTIAMANAGPDTNGSQFFINVGANSFLDDKHTVFGKVISGADVVMAINKVKTGEADRPIEPVIIQKIDVK
jgi:peptidylprolyl isomerase